MIEPFVAERLGRTLGGRWTLESVLGAGGMGAVYGARDPSGAMAAVKILHPEMGRRPEIRERFQREAYAANRLSHPGAVRVIDNGATDDQSAYLVMELLEGEPLSERVKRLGALSPEELLDDLDQVLDVLAVAHEQNIIHRDLKPDNLFLTSNGSIKVLDFGLARLDEGLPGDFRTKSGLALGTLPYMAPEQALGRRNEVDGRTDLFALGASAFRMLAGRMLHEAESEAELLMAMATKPPPPLASVAPHVPADVCAIIDLSLAFARDARYPDARTMQLDVRAVREGRRPPYASSLQRARDEATRADRPAAVVPSSPQASPVVPASSPSASTGSGAAARAPPVRVPTVVAVPAPPIPTVPAVPSEAVPASSAAPPASSPAAAAPTSSPVGAPASLGAPPGSGPMSTPASLGGLLSPSAPVVSSVATGASSGRKKKGPLLWVAVAASVLGALGLVAFFAFRSNDESAPLPAVQSSDSIGAPGSGNSEPGVTGSSGGNAGSLTGRASSGHTEPVRTLATSPAGVTTAGAPTIEPRATGAPLRAATTSTAAPTQTTLSGSIPPAHGENPSESAPGKSHKKGGKLR